MLSDQPRTPRCRARPARPLRPVLRKSKSSLSFLRVGLDENAGVSVKQRAHASVSDTCVQTGARRETHCAASQSVTAGTAESVFPRPLVLARRASRATTEEEDELLRQPTHRARHANAVRRRKHLRKSKRQDNDSERIGCSTISSKSMLACVTLPSQQPVVTQRHRAPLV